MEKQHTMETNSKWFHLNLKCMQYNPQCFFFAFQILFTMSNLSEPCYNKAVSFDNIFLYLKHI